MDFVCCVCDKIVSLFNLIWSFLTDNDMKVIELGLIAWGCYIAYKGLKTWREQVIEQPKIELARDVVESFYNVKDLIERARCTLISFDPDEIRKYYSLPELEDRLCGHLHRKFIFDTNYDVIDKFQKLRNKSKTYYSKEIEDCFMQVISIINRINSAVSQIIQDVAFEDRDFYKELKKVLINNDNDEINMKLQNIVNEVECNLKPLYETKAIKWKKFKR